MELRLLHQRLFWLMIPACILSVAPAFAEGEPSQKPGVLERIGDGAKKIGNKIEQGFTKAAKKLEQKKVGEKIERKMKKAANKTAEGFKKAGDKIDQKLNH